MHPDSATLVAYRDRELDEIPAREVERHIAGCPRCAGELQRLFREWNRIVAADADFSSLCAPAPDGLDRLLSAIQHYLSRDAGAAAGRERPVDVSELKRRIGEQLELYFGARIPAVLDTLPASPRFTEALLARVEPLLTTFLGRKAAGVVIEDLLKGLDEQACVTPGVV